MNLSVKEKQDLLAINELKGRALETLSYMISSCKKTWLKKWYSVVRFDLDQQQSEYFLHQQMKTIQEELVAFARGGNGRNAAKSLKSGMINLKHFERTF
jgi:ATP-dependent Lon protease